MLDEPTEVFRGPLSTAMQARDELRRNGVTAEVIDEPTPTTRQKSYGHAQVGVIVPGEDEARAREVLDVWRRQSEDRVRALGERYRGQVLLTLIPPLIFIVVQLSQQRPLVELSGALWIWLVSALVVGAADRLISRSR